MLRVRLFTIGLMLVVGVMLSAVTPSPSTPPSRSNARVQIIRVPGKAPVLRVAKAGGTTCAPFMAQLEQEYTCYPGGQCNTFMEIGTGLQSGSSEEEACQAAKNQMCEYARNCPLYGFCSAITNQLRVLSEQQGEACIYSVSGSCSIGFDCGS